MIMMRIQVFHAVNAVSLHGRFTTLWRWHEPPKQQDLFMQWHSIIFQRLETSLYHRFWAHWDIFPQRWYKFDQEGSTIAQHSNYNVRVLKYCTSIWLPAIRVIYCQHLEWVYKKPWYPCTMLKFGFLQTKTMTKSNLEREHFFMHIKEKEEWTDNFR